LTSVTMVFRLPLNWVDLDRPRWCYSTSQANGQVPCCWSSLGWGDHSQQGSASNVIGWTVST
jgi:hypothetical protein